MRVVDTFLLGLVAGLGLGLGLGVDLGLVAGLVLGVSLDFVCCEPVVLAVLPDLKLPLLRVCIVASSCTPV